MLAAVSSMRLYGTVTSPYVRRVRIVAQELGVSYDLVDTTTDEGQAALRSVNPLWKVPTAEIDGRAIMDSGVIIEHLMREHGPARLSPLDPSDRLLRNVCTVIDGVLDSLINTFYLARDGVGASDTSYVRKQFERSVAAMGWLEQRVDGLWLCGRRGFGVPEIALCTMVEWMRFRDTYPVERYEGLMRCVEHHGTRESLVQSRPPGA